MPQPGMQREHPEPANPAARAGDELVSPDAVMNAFAQACLAIPAIGAVIGVRDLQGIRCVISFGKAPPVGSRIGSEPEFSKRCIENGEVVLCDDLAADPCPPGIAGDALPGAAVAIPIFVHSEVAGVIELWSFEPFSIHPGVIGELKQVADSFAANMIFESVHGDQPIIGGPLDSPVVLTPPVAQQEIEPAAAVEAGEVATKAPLSHATSDLPTSSPKQKSSRKMIFAIAASLFAALLLILLFAAKDKRLAARPSLENNAATGTVIAGEVNHAGVASNAGPNGNSKAIVPAPRSLPLDRNVVSGSAASTTDPAPRPAKSKPGSARAVTSLTGPKNLARPNLAKRRLGAAAAAAALTGDNPDLGQPEFSATSSVPAPGESSALAGPIQPAKVSPPDFVLDHSIKGHSDWVTSVAFASDGNLTTGSWDKTVKSWDVKTGQRLQDLSGKASQVQSIAYSRDGRWFAEENSDNSVSLWNTRTHSIVYTLNSDKSHAPPIGNWVYSIAFSPDGRWLASGLDDKTVRIWDTSTGKKVRDLVGTKRSVIYIAFSPDGRHLASGSGEKDVEIWDVTTGKSERTLVGHTKRVFAAAFSPDGRWLATASGDKTVKLWDVATGRVGRSFAGHQNAVTSLAFSPDGRWLASGSWDKTVRIWDVATGSQVQALPPQAHAVYSVAFDHHGRWLASGSEDGTVKIWKWNDAPNRAVRPSP